MGNIVGIDLGTTNTVVARLDETGDPKIQPNLTGNHITPSAVYIREKDGNLEAIVGDQALLIEDYEKKPIYKEFKRGIGQKKIYDTIDGHDITPETLSSLVLKKCRRDFVAEQGDDITNCIITFPGNFNYERREATVYAGKSAEWPIHLGINEPSAAALYYSLMHTPKPGKYAVYDFGGGTWDISVVEINGLNIELLDSDGIAECGGKDFDALLQGIVEEKFQKKTGSKIDYKHPKNIKRAMFERTKISLTVLPKRNLGVYDKDNNLINIEVTRDEFEESIATLLAGTEMYCERLFGEHKDILDVILVGGSTRVPAVKKNVENTFGKPGITIGNPEDTVALGAALYSGLKSDKKDLNAAQIDKFRQIQFSEVTNHYFGVSTSKLINKETGERKTVPSYIINKNTPIPCSRSKDYYPVHDDQPGVRFKIFETRHKEEEMEHVEVMEEVDLDLPPGVKAYSDDGRTIVTFEKIEDGTLVCTFVLEKTGLTEKVSLFDSLFGKVDNDNDAIELLEYD